MGYSAGWEGDEKEPGGCRAETSLALGVVPRARKTPFCSFSLTSALLLLKGAYLEDRVSVVPALLHLHPDDTSSLTQHPGSIPS